MYATICERVRDIPQASLLSFHRRIYTSFEKCLFRNWRRREPSAGWILPHEALFRRCNSLSSYSWFFSSAGGIFRHRNRETTHHSTLFPIDNSNHRRPQPQPLIVHLVSNHFYSLSVSHNIKIIWPMVSAKHKEACCDLGLPTESYKRIRKYLHIKKDWNYSRYTPSSSLIHKFLVLVYMIISTWRLNDMLGKPERKCSSWMQWRQVYLYYCMWTVIRSARTQTKLLKSLEKFLCLQ